MIYKCDDCGSDSIVEQIKQNINTGNFVEVVDDSVACDDCGGRTIIEEEE